MTLTITLPENNGTTGKLFLIVGPSGVGKDTLLETARLEITRRQLPNFRFVRRYITRPVDSGGENHIAVAPHDFSRMIADRQFCVWWRAHDLSYGIHKDVVEWINRGQNVIVNGSRGSIEAFERLFPTTVVILITASKQALKSRLLHRNRESPEQIENRLNRPSPPIEAKHLIPIDNSGPIEDAVNRLTKVLLSGKAEFSPEIY